MCVAQFDALTMNDVVKNAGDICSKLQYTSVDICAHTQWAICASVSPRVCGLVGVIARLFPSVRPPVVRLSLYSVEQGTAALEILDRIKSFYCLPDSMCSGRIAW